MADKKELSLYDQRLLAEKKLRQAAENLYKIPPNSDIAVLDCSASMRELAMNGKTRMECLREAMQPFAGQVQVVAFADRVRECSVANIPAAGSGDWADDENSHGVGYGTKLHLALETVASLEPIHVLVVSDGEPDSKEAALEQADIIAPNAIIDVLYIGPGTKTSVEFMKELARRGHGRYQAFDTTNYSAAMIEGKAGRLLALPAASKVIKQ